ncbi:unnamed protein product [Rotaria magnacalcarata]|uniref:UNC93-like protein n=1 Tax=Rotaria magnacalcarata TaxID=392030 RepID=A0A818W706_9BILA|nr:unnamed protein product [Rotaria magnacalcarata]
MSFAISESQLKSHIENTADENDTPSESTSKTKFTFQTYKNPLVICTAFLLQFTAFSGISNLQSSLNTEANVGVNSLSIIYACLIISAIFLPHPLISILGLKWTIVMSQIPYLLYVAANYYPKSYIMYPAAAPLWTSKCSYLTDIGTIYAENKFLNKNVIVNRFFGIFFTFFQSGQVWGNLISYVVRKPKETGTNETRINTTVRMKYDRCGADFTEQEYKGAEVINQIDRKPINISLYVIYFNKSLFNSNNNMLSQSATKSIKRFIIIFSSFWGFITCTFNAKYVGFIFIAYGICDSIGSAFFGQLVKFMGRWPCFMIGAVINYSLIITMFIWKPTENRMFVLFILAGLWGLVDAVWQTQITSFYGILFVDKNEAAFSNYHLWESTGFVLFYIITPYIRIRIALIILLIFLTLGMMGYIATDNLLSKKKLKVSGIPRAN